MTHKGIQEDLYRMQKWAEEWNLYFNVNKCKVMHIGRKLQNMNITVHENFKGKRKLETSAEEKDQGITFDENLGFDTLIDNITKKTDESDVRNHKNLLLYR